MMFRRRVANPVPLTLQRVVPRRVANPVPLTLQRVVPPRVAAGVYPARVALPRVPRVVPIRVAPARVPRVVPIQVAPARVPRVVPIQVALVRVQRVAAGFCADNIFKEAVHMHRVLTCIMYRHVKKQILF